LDCVAIRNAVGLSRPDPLGIGLTIAYLEQKINEVRNLRMIIRGKALGMRNEQIAEWVMM
jgi:vacuolar-type H+-ATPase subunit C/Vma6